MDELSLPLVGAIVVAVAAYLIGRTMGRRAETRERDGLGTPPAPKAQGRRRVSQAMPSLAARDLEIVKAELLAGRKIAAIKEVRERTGLGLREAKDYVEAIAREMRL